MHAGSCCSSVDMCVAVVILCV